jgi:hypothetical protein
MNRKTGATMPPSRNGARKPQADGQGVAHRAQQKITFVLR